MLSRSGLYSGRRMAAAFAGGAAAGLIASRLLPPLTGMATGTVRFAAGGDPFSALEADHRRLTALLTSMEQSREQDVFHRAQLLLRLKRRLAAHALAEEDAVYPLLNDEVKAEEDARRLYGDHATIKILLHRLEELPKDSPAWGKVVRELHQLVGEHARHEEEVDFPKLRRSLDEAAMARLSRTLSREKALIL